MGLLPAANCGIPDPPEDCTILFDVASTLAALGHVGLQPFIPETGCDDFHTYVSMGKPPGDLEHDFLAVYLNSFGPVQMRRSISECASGVWPDFEAEYAVELWENCYPNVNDLGQIPAPATIQAFNAHVYAHGSAVYNAVLTGWLNKTASFPPKVQNISFGPLVPIPPEANAVGWKFTARVTLA